jgi:RpiR family transcriptional regulator, carbohydrate utilization regulator
MTAYLRSQPFGKPDQHEMNALDDNSPETGLPEMAAIEIRELDLLSTIRVLIPELSKSHKRIAEMVLADPHWAMQSNVDDLAARAGVGKPTVVRFARSVGCEGLKDFKLKLAGNLALGANYLHRAVRPADNTAEVLNNVVGSTLSTISEWHRSLNPDVLASAADIINRAGRIDCYGTGQTSHFLAQDLHARLFRMGMTSTVFTDAYLQLVAAATLTPDDTVIAISFVGRMANLLETVAMAKAHGAKIIAITRNGTPLAQMADIVLSVDVPADATMLVGTDAYITQILMIEIITVLVGRLRGPECERRLEQIHRLMHAKEHDTDASSVVYWDWKTTGT